MTWWAATSSMTTISVFCCDSAKSLLLLLPPHFPANKQRLMESSSTTPIPTPPSMRLGVSQKDAAALITSEHHAVKNSPGVVHVIHNVLSPEECQYFISQMESLGLEHVENEGYDPTYRNNQRVIVMNREIALCLMERIQGHAQPTSSVVVTRETSSTLPSGVMRGEWLLHHVNHCFRLCKYEPGGHFSPHYDADYKPVPHLRSLRTFMLYLNGSEFNGGTTNFIDEDHDSIPLDPRNIKGNADPAAVYLRVCPKAGSAVVFDHKMLHEGDKVVGGPKYIMRTELMYSPYGLKEDQENKKFWDRLETVDQRVRETGGAMRDEEGYGKLREDFPQLAKLWGM